MSMSKLLFKSKTIDENDEKILYYKDKIFRSTSKLYDKFRVSYDSLSITDIQCSFLSSYWGKCLHDEMEIFDCRCYTPFYRACYLEEIASLGADMVFHKENIYEILDWDAYCCCGAEDVRSYWSHESFDCDCDKPQYRVNAFAFFLVIEDYYRHHDIPFSDVNYKRIMRVIKAIDNMTDSGEVTQLFRALCHMFKTFDFSVEEQFTAFMGKFYHSLESVTERADLSYVPDLVMGLKPELLAQVGDNLVSSQCLRDKIDTLIWEADRLEAQSFFGVDVNIPSSTSATLLSIISELKDSIKETLTTAFKLSVIAVAAILYLVLAFVIIHRIVTLKPRYLAMMHIICTLAILYNDETSCLHTILQWCKERFNSVAKNEKVAEDGMIDSRMLSFIPLFAISSMNIPVKVSEKLVTSKFLDSLGRKISFLGDARFYGGLSTINSWATQAFEIVKKHFHQWLGLEYVPDLSSEKDTYLDWAERTEKIIEEYYNRKLLFSESERAYITSLYSEGIKLARHPVYKVASHDILHACRSLLIIVEKVNAKLNVSGSLRNPPVTLMLYGDTGAGKSSLTFPLSVAILLEVYKRENNDLMREELKSNCHRLIYTRNSEQEFWDGYTGQTVCVFDDWNQMIDSASNPSMELFELIRASNVFPYPLHMAHLEDKASVNFSSDIIICSSNNQKPKVESLNFPKALIRRFTSFVHVERTHSDDKRFSFKDYTLTPYDPETGERKDALTVEAFISQAVDEYLVNKGFVSSINTFVEELFAQDGSGEPDRQAPLNLYNKFHLLKLKEKLDKLRLEYKWLATFKYQMIIGAITLIGAGLALYQYFSREETVAESSISSYVRARKNLKKERTEEAYEPLVRNQQVTTEDQTEAYEPIVKSARLVSEGCVDQVATEMGAKLARSNLYRVYLRIPSEVIPLGHCLFLKGSVAIIPMHFVYIMRSYGDNNSIYFSNVQLDQVYETRVKDVQFTEYIDKYGNHKDIASFQLRHVREHADILNMFAPSGTLRTTGATEIALIMLNCVSPKYPLVLDRRYKSGHSCIKHIQDPEAYRLTAVNALIKIHSAWEYSLETQKGDCGAPLMVLNDRIAPGKIIGIHVAGSAGIGMSTTMFHEDVKSICSNYRMFAQARTLELLDGSNPYEGIELDYLGDIEKPVIQPSKSKIIPSPLHGVLSVPKTDLTWLRPRRKDGEMFDPLAYRTHRMGKRSVCIPIDLIDLAREGLLREFKRIYLKHQDSLSGRFECPYSFETTCVGVDGEEFVNAIKRDTSAGFPFTQMGVTRAQIFGTEEEYRVDTPEAKEIFELVKFYEESAVEGIVFDHYFVDTLKDERKPIEKCHKTRMFAAGPIDYLIWSKRWFNGVVAIISELRNIIHISVGTNVYSDDWHMMAEGLLRKSDLFVAGDFEGFDASEQAYILRTVLDVLIDFSQYIFGEDPFARVQMNAIAVGLIFSFHISGKNVFQWLKSLPSGHYLTAIANSIFVLLVLSAAYLLALQKKGQLVNSLDVDFFWENFGVVAYGDDHIIAVPHSCAAFYNQNTLVELLREFGLYYTDEQKSAKGVADTRPLTDISYLKRSFYFDSGVGKWLAPLSIDVILETPMWIRKCPDIQQQTFNNIEFALRELSMHNEETWNKYAPILLSLAESKCGLVSKFFNKSTTLLFVLDTMMTAQSQDVIFGEKENMQGPNLRQLLSREEAVGIYPYHTGSAQAAPKHPVNLARLQRVGALEAEVYTPADTPEISNFSTNSEEVKDVKYMDQNANDEVMQITTFENDMSIATQDVPMPVPLDLGLRSMHTDDAHHTITSFLKRPMILREFVWDSSQVRGDDIFEKIRIPFDMLVRQFKDKLQGFMSFRATAVINIQFQTQPFQAGRCIVAAVPLPNLIGKRTKIIEGRISNLTLLNHVQADIAKQTEVTLRVPYVSPLIAYDLVQGRYDWAEVVGKVYSPVTSVGTTNIEGIVYVHFEDIQLGAPTSMPLFSTMEAQSGSASKKVPFEPEVMTDVRQRAQELGISASNSSRVTGGLRKINSNISDYIKPIKPVTDALDKFLLKPIDDFVGPILNIFGFSKPLTVADDKLLRPTTNLATFHGTDRALTLATSEDINAPFLPHLNGSELDEMSFDYLKKIPQYIDNFTFSTTNSRNDVLHTFYVRPCIRVTEQLKFTYQTTQKTIYQPSHLAYISEPFLYWTGSLVLTYKFVKTDYHSGRVEITYHPNCNPCSGFRTIKDNVDFDMAYRFIVDLREKSEISLRIPYIAVTPFKRNISDLYAPSDPQRAAVENNSGVVVVRALTPLKASNAVVSNKIEVLVEYNAGNDFQVMNPVTCRYNPITPLEEKGTKVRDLDRVTQEQEKEDDYLSIGLLSAQGSEASDWSGYYSDSSFEAQAGEASVAGLAITRQQALEGEDPPSITNNLGEIRADSSSFAVTGEKFSNYRDLCHRTNFVLKVENAGTFSQALHRFYIPPPTSRDGAASADFKGFYYNNRGNSALGYVGSMYALCRGSINVRVMPKNYEGYVSAKLFSEQSKVSDCLFPRAIEKSNIKGLAEFHVPYYCRTYQFDHLKYDRSLIYDLEFNIAVPSGTAITASAAVSGGDDIAFGYFVGTPVTLFPAVTLYSGGADPFDHSPQKTDTSIVIAWDDISVIS